MNTSLSQQINIQKAFGIEPHDVIKANLDSKLEKGVIDQPLYDKAVEQLDQLVKGGKGQMKPGHKYLHREEYAPGKYNYIYRDTEGKLTTSNTPPSGTHLASEYITNLQTRIQNRKQEAISKIEAYEQFMSSRTNTLKEKLPEFEKFFAEKGFAINNIQHIGKTGFHGDETDIKPDEDQLRVSGTLQMIGRRKPITGIDSRNYNKRGTTNAAEKARSITNEIEHEFRNKFGSGLSINHFSMDKPDRVLFELWIK